jgi:hypothetical protein
MKYDHPSITIEEPAPGYLVIRGHQPKNVFVDGIGHFVPPDACVITKEIPADLLRAIADAKDGGKAPVPDIACVPQPEEDTEDSPTLLERVLNVLSEGNIQVGKLAERLDVTPEEIKALDGSSAEFHIAHAGWVKPGKKGGEA